MNPTVMGCVAGSALLRKAASVSFQYKKRSTLTSDIIECLGKRLYLLVILVILLFLQMVQSFKSFAFSAVWRISVLSSYFATCFMLVLQDLTTLHSSVRNDVRQLLPFLPVSCGL